MNYRHRITFQNDTSDPTDVDPDYSSFLRDVPCTVIPVSGGERYRGVQLQAETNHVIETRYYAGLLPNMIAVNDITSKEYLISRILEEDGIQRTLIIEATEVVV